VAAVLGAAPDHRRAHAAYLRYRRPLDAAQPRRLSVPRHAPGGRHYEVFPINAFEAESRRLARFFRIGHTPGPMEVDEPRIDPEFPFTLDLRKI